jgi:hypothetical protein
MNSVPVGCQPVVGHVLAHWGNDDAIDEFKWAKLNRGKKLAHAIFFL